MSDSKAALHVADIIAKRWSPSVFSSRPISPETIESLFEAARWAPSSYNEQPWSFIMGIKGRGDSHSKIASCLNKANSLWAPSAPLLILCVTHLRYNLDDRANRYARHDAALATENLLLQAVAFGLHAHPMGGFDRAKAQRLFAIPDDYEPLTTIAVGYLASGEQPGQRVRRPLSETVYEGRWGQGARFAPPEA